MRMVAEINFVVPKGGIHGDCLIWGTTCVPVAVIVLLNQFDLQKLNGFFKIMFQGGHGGEPST